MDNLYFKKLPSNALPSVSGNDVVLVETDSGDFVLIDSNGAKTLLNVDKAFPVGTVLCRANDVSPASDIGGTWQKIAEGRVIIGASDAYPLDSTGGSADAVVVNHRHLQTVSPASGTGANTWDAPTLYGAGAEVLAYTTYAGESGTGKNMMPYVAKNYWQRVA